MFSTPRLVGAMPSVSLHLRAARFCRCDSYAAGFVRDDAILARSAGALHESPPLVTNTPGARLGDDRLRQLPGADRTVAEGTPTTARDGETYDPVNMASLLYPVPTRKCAKCGAAPPSRDLFAILRLFGDLAHCGPAAGEDGGFTRVGDGAVPNPPRVGGRVPGAPLPAARRNETNDSGTSALLIYWLPTPTAREMGGILPSREFVCDYAIIR